MQSGELVRFDGRTPPVWGGADFKGPSPLDRFYEASDGWVRLQASTVESLQRAGVIDPSATWKTDSDLASLIATHTATRPAGELVECLNAAAIPAVVARMPGDLTEDRQLQELEIVATLHMQDGTPFFSANRYARFSRTQQHNVFTPPGVGEHSREVLGEAGVSASEIDAVVESGAVKQGTPFEVVGIQNYR
jgi:crotonobetainyl-CoA:carnitine CoA-transferase CaiB-like acyl-CoA transferase